jgi:hypothetical protein
MFNYFVMGCPQTVYCITFKRWVLGELSLFSYITIRSRSAPPNKQIVLPSLGTWGGETTTRVWKLQFSEKYVTYNYNFINKSVILQYHISSRASIRRWGSNAVLCETCSMLLYVLEQSRLDNSSSGIVKIAPNWEQLV